MGRKQKTGKFLQQVLIPAGSAKKEKQDEGPGSDSTKDACRNVEHALKERNLQGLSGRGGRKENGLTRL